MFETFHLSIVLAVATDVISRLFDSLFLWGEKLPPAIFLFPVKAVLLLAIPHLLCALYMHRQTPTPFSQATLCLIGILLAGAIPIDWISISSPMIRTWIWILCIAALCFLPRLLPTVVVPTIGAQRRFTHIIYTILALLFLANLF